MGIFCTALVAFGEIRICALGYTPTQISLNRVQPFGRRRAPLTKSVAAEPLSSPFRPRRISTIEQSRLFVGRVAASPSSIVSQKEGDDEGYDYIHDEEDIKTRTDKLLSYAYSLQQTRKHRNSKRHGDNTMKHSSTAAAKSLVAYLTHNPLIVPVSIDGDENQEGREESIQQQLVVSCERAIIQALRVAGETGDYRLIISLIESSIIYANNHSILTTRIFGEAIQILASQTSSNVSKIRHVWNLLVTASEFNDETFLRGNITAFELNVMLKALASRGKVGPCLDLYRKHTSTTKKRQSSSRVIITPDPYTASTLFTILKDSIRADQRNSLKNHQEIVDSNAATSTNSKPTTSSSLGAKLAELASPATSPCWQWNTAIELISSLSVDSSKFQWNNHVFGALLRLQDRAQEVFDYHKSKSSQVAVTVIESMISDYKVEPDVVTLTLAMKAIGETPSTTELRGKGDSWKMALRLLEQMKTDSSLPKPNVYTYSAAIMACARSNAYQEAIKLLEEMTSNQVRATSKNLDGAVVDDGEEWHPPKPNTWVYNAALLAMAGPSSVNNDSSLHSATASSSRRRHREQRQFLDEQGYDRRSMALNLLKQMDDFHQRFGMDTSPDTVTYNTVLGIVASPPSKKDRNATASSDSTDKFSEDFVQHLLAQMKEKGVARDAITYHNAILASRGDGSKIVAVVDAALADIQSINDSLETNRRSLSSTSNHYANTLEDKARNGITFVFNSALSVLSRDWKHFQVVIQRMKNANARMNAETTSHFINALGRGSRIPAISLFLVASSAKDINGAEPVEAAKLQLMDLLDQILPGLTLPVEKCHYTEAISVCLVANEIEEAHRILSLMRKSGMNPTNECLEKFCLAYSRLAVRTASKEKAQRKHSSEQRKIGNDSNGAQTVDGISQKRAQNAYSIAMALTEPSPHMLCAVAKACAVTSMWEEGRSMLQALHNYHLNMPAASTLRSGIASVPGTHEMLLRQAAMEGDLQAALWYADDIQRFSRKMRAIQNVQSDSPRAQSTSGRFGAGLDDDSLLSSLREMSSVKNGAHPVSVGMKAECWRHVLTAASKAGNWRVCLNTLQNLRPALQKIRPIIANTNREDLFNTRYTRLAPALITVARCLEKHAQYAWAVRVIDDWMEWSGRRPRVEAVSAAFRSLSARGRGEEVNSLLLRCALQQDENRDESLNSVSYEELLFVRAVTSLHYNGLYDDADDAYLAGISQGHLFLPLDDHKKDGDGKVVLDLHGMNVALAHSAVRIAMRQTAIADSGNSASASDMIIVTGRGRNSALQLRPVLRPEVQRMLLEEFYPPLNTFSVPNNMGALIVPSGDISAWQAHQREQKGARMLAVAALLKKNLSSVNLLRQRIAAAAALRGETNTTIVQQNGSDNKANNSDSPASLETSTSGDKDEL